MNILNLPSSSPFPNFKASFTYKPKAQEEQAQVQEQTKPRTSKEEETRRLIKLFLRIGLIAVAVYLGLVFVQGSLLAPVVATINSHVASGALVFTTEQIANASLARTIGSLLTPTLTFGCMTIGMCLGLWIEHASQEILKHKKEAANQEPEQEEEKETE